MTELPNLSFQQTSSCDVAIDGYEVDYPLE